MSSLLIRPIQETDYPQLLAIENSVWNTTNTPSHVYYASIADYQHYYPVGTQFVALSDQVILGILQYHNATTLTASKKTLSMGIAIAPNAQHQGVGSALIKHIKSYAKQHNYHKITLRALGTNPHALAFYKKNQFVIEGILKDEFFIDGRFVDDYLLSYFIA